MRVNNNTGAFSVFKYYERTTAALQNSMEKLSSGLRIVRPGDDAAGLGISEKFRAQVANTAMSVNNIENMVSMIQTTDGWMQNIQDMLNRMSELAIEARDGTKSTTDRQNLAQEFDQIKAEISAITTGSAQKGKYNTKNLFSTGGFTIQVGADYNMTFQRTSIDLRTNGANAPTKWGSMFDLAISTEAWANSAISIVGRQIVNIASKRAVLGAEQNRLQYTMEGLRNYQENIGKAESLIRDVNVAQETTKFTRHQILMQSGTAMLAQANTAPQSVLALIGG